MLQASPAVCEIDGCGVLAVGRCATCQRAFCLTHQGRSLNAFAQLIPYVDRCASCEASREAKRAEQEAEWRPQSPQEYFKSGAARTALLTSGAPTVELYEVRQQWEVKKGLFGRSGQYVDVVTSFGRGWIIGEFKWKYHVFGGYGGTDVVKVCLTALLDVVPPEINQGYRPEKILVRVQPYSGGYQVLDFGEGKFLGFGQSGELRDYWSEAMQAVKRLAGKSS